MEPQAEGQEQPFTARTLHDALAGQPTGGAAGRVAERLRAQFGQEALAQGAAPLIEDLTVAWAIEAPAVQGPPVIVSQRGLPFRQGLTRLGETDVYALAVALPEGTALQTAYQVDGILRGGAGEAGQIEVYRQPPESRGQPGTPRGALLAQPRWRSTLFPGTVRDWWLYVPAQYEAAHPASVMVFQDGTRTKSTCRWSSTR